MLLTEQSKGLRLTQIQKFISGVSFFSNCDKRFHNSINVQQEWLSPNFRGRRNPSTVILFGPLGEQDWLVCLYKI